MSPHTLSSTDPSFSPRQVSSPIPQSPLLSEPVECRPAGKRPTSNRPPGSCRPPLGVWCEPGPCTGGFTLARLVWVRPGQVHFSQDQCHPLSHIPAMFQQGQKALNPTKTKQSRVFSLKAWIYLNKLFTFGARLKYRHEYFSIAAMKYALIHSHFV